MSDTIISATRPLHDVNEETRFATDFFTYLDQPENATRYTPATYWLTERFGQTVSVLDLGCGTASLLRYLPAVSKYYGVDHVAGAIQACRHLFPEAEFMHADIDEALDHLIASGRRFDAVVLCGVLSHLINKSDLTPKDDQKLVETCVRDLIVPDGALVIIVGVPFRNDLQFSFYRQAEWKHSIVSQTIKTLPVRVAHVVLTMQVGLEEKIRKQSQIPDWFIINEQSATPNRHTGSRIGALTMIVTPRSA